MGQGEPTWEWNEGDSYTDCTCSRSPPCSPGRLPLPQTRHRKGDGARYFAWSPPGTQTPRASCGRSTPSRRFPQNITPRCPASGIFPGLFLPSRLAPHWTSPSKSRRSSSMAAWSDEGGLHRTQEPLASEPSCSHLPCPTTVRQTSPLPTSSSEKPSCVLRAAPQDSHFPSLPATLELPDLLPAPPDGPCAHPLSEGSRLRTKSAVWDSWKI